MIKNLRQPIWLQSKEALPLPEFQATIKFYAGNSSLSYISIVF